MCWGGLTADISARFGITEAEFLVLLLVHAIPELVGLFLPLAAWLLASRRGAWHQLMAATVVTTAIGLVMVLIAAMIETLRDARAHPGLRLRLTAQTTQLHFV